MKDELRSQEELSVAAVAYITPMWLVLGLFRRWRSNSFTRYHFVHAALGFCTFILAIVGLSVMSFLSNFVIGYHLWFVLLTGLLLGFLLLASAGLALYCGMSAYRGRYTVIPVLTRIYYSLFAQRKVQRHDLYDSRNITERTRPPGGKK